MKLTNKEITSKILRIANIGIYSCLLGLGLCGLGVIIILLGFDTNWLFQIVMYLIASIIVLNIVLIAISKRLKKSMS